MADLVSVVIVNWNGINWLEKCLTSVTDQDHSQIEIIFVDNASTDGSVEFVQSKYPSALIISNKQNYGFAKGNNIGVKAANGKHILLLNNDSWIKPDLISNLLEEKIKKRLDVIAPLEGDYEGRERPPYTTTLDILGHPVVRPNVDDRSVSFYLRGVCLLFSKELYLETGGLDEDFFMYVEECDWFWRLNLLNRDFNYSTNNFVYHNGGSSTGKGIKETVFSWRNQNTLQMLLKNYALPSLVLIIPLYLLQNFIEMLYFLLLLKLRIVQTYIHGLAFNLRNIGMTWKKHKLIQSSRVVSDRALLSKLYLGPGKLRHLFMYYAK